MRSVPTQYMSKNVAITIIALPRPDIAVKVFQQIHPRTFLYSTLPAFIQDIPTYT
jgi:hypothetical protein